jgi:hypothetical protein
VADIRVILLLDIGTFFITLLTISCVRRTIHQDRKVQEPLKRREELAVGFQYIRGDKAVASLVWLMPMPFSNTCADVLIRVRIPNELQGRVWGMISLLTQTGSVIAFATCGLLADQVFEKWMQKD